MGQMSSEILKGKGQNKSLKTNMSQPGVAYAVRKGEKIVKDNDFQMIG